MLLNCPYCGDPFEVPVSLLGQRGACPHCGGEIDFPGAVASEAGGTGIGRGSGDDSNASWWSRWGLVPRADPRRNYERVGSFIGSFLIHLALLALIVYWVSKPVVGNPGSGLDVGIADLPESELTKASDGDFSAQTTADASADASTAEFQPVEVESPSESTSLESLEMASTPVGGGSSGGAGAGEPRLAGGGDGSGGGKANFMGVDGYGTRFVIIADRSRSMEGSKLDYLKNELIKTLRDLKPAARFYVVFYNETAEPAPGAKWLAGKPGVRSIEPWVQQIISDGGTDPLPAFRVAFAMSPRPDTIFFMSDGLFEPTVPAAVAQLNQSRRKTVIHAISFVDQSAEHLMRQIAEQSGGKYRHVAGPRP